MQTDRAKHVDRFYELLNELEDGLGGKRRFRDCSARQSWPQRGVYFIFEDGEKRAGCSNSMRVTRVGTHAIREGEVSTLWGRIKNHRGTQGGGGNHRGSVFRRHVGSAMINRSNNSIVVPTWSIAHPSYGERQEEKDLERMVSEHIGGAWLLWIAIDDVPSPMSDRAYIEKHSIALLSAPINKELPSKEWLGNYSSRNEIKMSGLWNVDHVGTNYSPEFLDRFEVYVKSTIRENR